MTLPERDPKLRSPKHSPGSMQPWVVYNPKDHSYYIGMHCDEYDAWRVARGWPDLAEIDQLKSEGWYAVPAQVTWKAP